jgi:hypothetical protein
MVLSSATDGVDAGVARPGRTRRDAVLAVRPRWREAVALTATAVLVLTLPLAAWAVATTGEQLARVERAATTLEDAGPRAAAVASTLADVTHRLADLADQQGPALVQVSDGVAGVTGELRQITAELQPLTGTLGSVAKLLPKGAGLDGLSQATAAIDGITQTVDTVASTTADVAAQVRQLTSPDTIAVLNHAADAVSGLATVSNRAGDLAAGYVDHAATIALAARVLAVASLMGTLTWLAWRVREHGRWRRLRRTGVGVAVLDAVASAA